jgi:hypothetical protein
MSKKKIFHGFVVVGSHDKPFVTLSSPRYACEGRYEIYETERDAKKNGDRVVPCEIILDLKHG